MPDTKEHEEESSSSLIGLVSTAKSLLGAYFGGTAAVGGITVAGTTVAGTTLAAEGIIGGVVPGGNASFTAAGTAAGIGFVSAASIVFGIAVMLGLNPLKVFGFGGSRPTNRRYYGVFTSKGEKNTGASGATRFTAKEIEDFDEYTKELANAYARIYKAEGLGEWYGQITIDQKVGRSAGLTATVHGVGSPPGGKEFRLGEGGPNENGEDFAKRIITYSLDEAKNPRPPVYVNKYTPPVIKSSLSPAQMQYFVNRGGVPSGVGNPAQAAFFMSRGGTVFDTTRLLPGMEGYVDHRDLIAADKITKDYNAAQKARIGDVYYGDDNYDYASGLTAEGEPAFEGYTAPSTTGAGTAEEISQHNIPATTTADTQGIVEKKQKKELTDLSGNRVFTPSGTLDKSHAKKILEPGEGPRPYKPWRDTLADARQKLIDQGAGGQPDGDTALTGSVWQKFQTEKLLKEDEERIPFEERFPGLTGPHPLPFSR